jgi:hypothetical protein
MRPAWYPAVVDTRRNELILTKSFAATLARVAASLDDPEVCDEHLLLELLALGDRAEESLARLNEAERRRPH